MSTSLNEWITEWVFHWMSTWLNENFTEWVFHWMNTSVNEYFTEWVLQCMSTCPLRFLWDSDHATCSTLKRTILKSLHGRILWSFFNNFTFNLSIILFWSKAFISVIAPKLYTANSVAAGGEKLKVTPTQRRTLLNLFFMFLRVIAYKNLSCRQKELCLNCATPLWIWFLSEGS